MPTARDLLQQADALMRSNKNVGASDSGGDVPLLTDVAIPGNSGVSYRQQRDKIPVLTNTVTITPGAAPTAPRESDSLAQFSLTSAVPDSTMFPISQMPRTTLLGPLPVEDQTGRRTDVQTEPVFSVTAMRTQLAETGDWDAELLKPAQTGPSPAAAEAGARAAEIAEIAENVYHQVLQNLDLYTERALQEHLTSHLTPILERASSELLSTLHANLGALIRHFVAEAIEKQLGVRPESSK